MVLYNELPVYRDTYNLMIEVYQVTNKFATSINIVWGKI